MPTYQYRCTDCGEQLEVVQKFSDDQLTVCPRCEGKLRKVFSAVGIVFKGSGFYRTDSRNGSSAASAPAKESGSSETAASNGSSSESGKSESGKSGSGKSESGKSESKKSESGKSESGSSASAGSTASGSTGSGGKSREKAA